MAKRKIIIDCDPGIDDAYAILYALAHENIDVLGITTVSGNVNVDKTTRNAQKLVSLSGKSVPIAKGADKPLVKTPFYAENIHGKNGLGNYELDIDRAPLHEKNALEWLKETLEKEEKVTLVAVGPLTNIAQLLLVYPHLKEKIEEIVVMGGGLRNGNTTPAAEFNFYVDPEAAKIVFDSQLPLTMAGLDVTEKCLLYKDDIEKLKNTSFVAHELANMSESGKKVHGIRNVYTALHDLVAVMYCVQPELFEIETYHVDVVVEEGLARGMTIADRRMVPKLKPNTNVILDVNREGFVEETLRTYRKYR